MERMTIEQFLDRSEADVQAFVLSTQQAQAEGTEGFVGRFTYKTRADWWREVAAYYEVAEEVRVECL